MSVVIGFAATLLLFTLLIKLGNNQVCKTVCTSESTQNINSMLRSFRMGPGDEVQPTARILEPIPQSFFMKTIHIKTEHRVVEIPVENQSEFQPMFGINSTALNNIQLVIPSHSMLGTQQNVPTDVRNGADHPGQCEILKSGIDNKGIEDILHLHNKLRSKVAQGKQAGLPTANKMMQLKWNEEMAELAQEHSNNCQFKHNIARIHKYDGKLGQNVAISFSPVKDLKPNFKTPVANWYAEVNQFNHQDISPFLGKHDTGHFTQVIWSDTSEVGCGYTIFYVKEKANYYKLTVCNYGTGGNILSYPIYKAGEPCSKCSSCSGRYPGLCLE